MLAKVWRDNKFTGAEGRVSGNQCRDFCQVCYLVRLTTCRGESLLKAYEKINRGWSVQGYSSFEIVTVRPLQRTDQKAPVIHAEDEWAYLLWGLGMGCMLDHPKPNRHQGHTG